MLANPVKTTTSHTKWTSHDYFNRQFNVVLNVFIFLLHLFLSFYLLTAHSHSHTHTMHGLAYDHWLCRWITQFATITDNPIWTLCDDLKKWQTREIFGLIRKKWFWNEWNISYNSFGTMFIFISKNGNLNNSLNESTVFHWFEWIVYRCSCEKKKPESNEWKKNKIDVVFSHFWSPQETN